MKIIISIVAICTFLFSCGTSKQVTSAETIKNAFTDTVLSSVLSQSSVVIAAQAISQSNNGRKAYFILALQNNKWFKINYTDEGYRSPTYTNYILDKKEIAKQSGDSILKVFLSQKFKNIKDNDEGCLTDMTAEERKNNNCGVYDGQATILTLYNNKLLSAKSYTAPEGNLCCKGKEDRQIFIECKAALYSIK